MIEPVVIKCTSEEAREIASVNASVNADQIGGYAPGGLLLRDAEGERIEDGPFVVKVNIDDEGQRYIEGTARFKVKKWPPRLVAAIAAESN